MPAKVLNMQLEELAFFLDHEIYLLEEDNNTALIGSFGESGSLKFYGDNKNHICCVFEYAGVFTKSAEYELIQKIFAALKFTLLELALVNTAENSPFTIEQLVASLSPKKLIIFGLEPSQLGIHTRIAIHTPTDWGGIQVLWAAPLASIQSDIPTKREFWEALKELFRQ